METITVESIPIVVGREVDGRWWAGIESMPGVMAYGATEEAGPALLPQIARKPGDLSGVREMLRAGGADVIFALAARG